MAWTSMHFAVGMGCTGAAVGLGCLVLRRGWRWLPAAMTAGGLWALGPDLPRIFREDLPRVPLAPLLGSRQLERSLHEWGDLFFFHRTLDAQPNEYALHGVALIVLFFNVACYAALRARRRRRDPLAHRVRRAHGGLANGLRRVGRNDRRSRLDDADTAPASAAAGVVTERSPSVSRCLVGTWAQDR